MVTIGVLALQGDVAEHVRALENSGARALLVRRVSELDQVDGGRRVDHHVEPAAVLRTV